MNRSFPGHSYHESFTHQGCDPFLFKSTNLLYLQVLFYAVGPFFSAITRKIQVIGYKGAKSQAVE
jgi:hypothetical protein